MPFDGVCPRCGWHGSWQRGISREQKSAIQRDYPRAFSTWTPDDLQLLAKLCQEGATLIDMTVALQRPPHTIKSRIEALGLKVRSKEEAAELHDPHGEFLTS